MSRLGWRWWDIQDGQLSSVNSIGWGPGEPIQAECLFGSDGRHRGQKVPVADCRCGLWAFDDPEIASGLNHSGSYIMKCKVFGVVECWGKMQEHLYGFRAEWAVPKAVVVLRGRLHPLYFNGEDAIQRFASIPAMIKVWDEEYNR